LLQNSPSFHPAQFVPIRIDIPVSGGCNGHMAAHAAVLIANKTKLGLLPIRLLTARCPRCVRCRMRDVSPFLSGALVLNGGRVGAFTRSVLRAFHR
ncbi:uncharacterized, partial [Tachysurus ichikawai]